MTASRPAPLLDDLLTAMLCAYDLERALQRITPRAQDYRDRPFEYVAALAAFRAQVDAVHGVWFYLYEHASHARDRIAQQARQ